MNAEKNKTGPRGLTEAEKQLKAEMAVEMQQARRLLLTLNLLKMRLF